MLSAENVNNLWKEQNENENGSERTINKQDANKEIYIRHSFSTGVFWINIYELLFSHRLATHSVRNAASSYGFKQSGPLESGDEVKNGWGYTSSLPTWLHSVNSDTYTVNFDTTRTP